MGDKTNSIFKDALILCVITLIAGIALSFINQLTKGPIEDRKLDAKAETYKVIYPDAVNFRYDDALTAQVKAADEEISSLDFGNVHIDEAVEATDADGNVIGHIISTTTGDGYNGDIVVAVAITADGTVGGVDMLEINETAGLGMKADEDSFKDQYAGKHIEAFTVVKGDKNADNEIDAISGATITSQAVTNAVNASLYFNNNYIGK